MHKCLRCDEILVRIHVIDQISSRRRVGFQYTIDPPEASYWSSMIRNAAGVIHAYLCQRCKRVEFYAHEGEELQIV